MPLIIPIIENPIIGQNMLLFIDPQNKMEKIVLQLY